MKENKKYIIHSDLKKVDSIKDSEIDYTDHPETSVDFWKDAKLVKPIQKKSVNLSIDQDILDFL